MSKITEYTSASTFDANDVLLKDGENGTMIISVEDAASEFKRLSGVDDDISGITQTVAQSMGTISSNIAGVETDYIASKDYAIGDLFIVNNVLYKATAAIAEEDVIDTEINCAVVNLGDEIGDIRSELANKANVDGSYSTLTAGNAEQLVGTVFTEDDAAYTFRTAGGSADIGDREYDEIVGGSIVWNQLMAFDTARIPTDRSGVTFKTDDQKTVTLNGTATQPFGADGWFGFSETTSLTNDRAGHVVLFRTTELSGTHDKDIRFSGSGLPTTSLNSATIFKLTYSETPDHHRIAMNVSAETVIENLVFTGSVFDLTQMFGSEIADYIYNLEQTTPGAGVAWFRKYFPKDYYEYNAGELKHVEGLSSHDMVGFNQLDESVLLGITGIVKSGDEYTYREQALQTYTLTPGWEGIRYIEGMPYCVSCEVTKVEGTNAYLIIYHTDGTYVASARVDRGNTGKISVTSSPGKTVKVVNITYGNAVTAFDKISFKNLCINLSWDGERDGEYEPYVKRSYPLDSSLTLRGIPKLSTDGKLYFDGDRYASDGTVTRKYGIVDLGTLEWIAEGNNSNSFRIELRSAKLVGLCLCMKYKCVQESRQANMVDGELSITNTQNLPLLRIQDSSYTDAATFKAAMSGVYLVYELAEPTTEEAQPFQSPQIVDDFGTEEYVTSSIVPVGHITQYDSNLRAKLEMAPNSPDGDGDYLVRQTGGQNEYVPYTDGGRITALEGKIPAAPSENGSYILKCTVTDGTATYAWVAE